MPPDVTNQADKEQGLLRTDAQLWVAAVHCCQAREKERERRKRKRERDKRRRGKNHPHFLKIIDLDQSMDIPDKFVLDTPVTVN